MPVIYMGDTGYGKSSMRNYPGTEAFLQARYQSDEGFKFWAAAQTEKGA
jgi:hypothetical protein